jgi:hypothetical protein
MPFSSLEDFEMNRNGFLRVMLGVVAFSVIVALSSSAEASFLGRFRGGDCCKSSCESSCPCAEEPACEPADCACEKSCCESDCGRSRIFSRCGNRSRGCGGAKILRGGSDCCCEGGSCPAPAADAPAADDAA